MNTIAKQIRTGNAGQHDPLVCGLDEFGVTLCPGCRAVLAKACARPGRQPHNGGLPAYRDAFDISWLLRRERRRKWLAKTATRADVLRIVRR